MRPPITIFGGSQMRPGSPSYEEAVELGRLLGEAGYDVVNGGFGGAMEATARGAKETGATVVGVTLGRYGKAGNRFLDKECPKQTFWERTQVMIERGMGFIVLAGSTGTLAELAVTWEIIHKEIGDRKPLILLGAYWRPLVDILCPSPDASAWCDGALRVGASPAEVVGFLDEFFGRTAMA